MPVGSASSPSHSDATVAARSGHNLPAPTAATATEGRRKRFLEEEEAEALMDQQQEQEEMEEADVVLQNDDEDALVPTGVMRALVEQ